MRWCPSSFTPSSRRSQKLREIEQGKGEYQNGKL
nr:MAG TPA: hypothetical protein [Caudoviricetes sp.]